MENLDGEDRLALCLREVFSGSRCWFLRVLGSPPKKKHLGLVLFVSAWLDPSPPPPKKKHTQKKNPPSINVDSA